MSVPAYTAVPVGRLECVRQGQLVLMEVKTVFINREGGNSRSFTTAKLLIKKGRAKQDGFPQISENPVWTKYGQEKIKCGQPGILAFLMCSAHKGLGEKEINEIIDQGKSAVNGWQRLAGETGISGADGRGFSGLRDGFSLPRSTEQHFAVVP